jgi:hypothetical protein
MGPHRVFARFLGKTAFVHSFADAASAARLTLQLRHHFAATRGTFWHSTQPTHAATPWPVLRRCLTDTVKIPGGPRARALQALSAR